MKLPTLEDLNEAAKVVYQSMPPTPQYSWPLLNARTGSEVWVKHENHTPVGAFKIRGGLVYINALRRDHPEIKGVIAATRGNFGQAVGFAAKQHGLAATIVVPFGNSREKNRAMQALGVDLVEQGEDFQAACEASVALERERGFHRVASFGAIAVHGTGTFAMEFFNGAPELDTVYVPIGLGSSICGVMAARDALGLKTKVVGVVAKDAPAYAMSFRAGEPVSHSATTQLADGLACRTPVPESLELILRGAERVIEVTEEEIADAMRAFFEDTHNVAEGAGAAALAGLMQERDRMKGKRAGVILTGGNVDREIFSRVLMGTEISEEVGPRSTMGVGQGRV
jgi:threonine dehydratase